ncbi:MAG: CehA/McbA family metallohydrolase [Clostridia bacterium]|nr:CehA/McbA family metallohydrolase [Clostridia bacterium]
MKFLIDEKKTQFKANLHCHTNLSDGNWTPQQVKEEYKKRGYSVVAITDHERLVAHNDLTDDEILFLTAYEAYIRNFPFDAMTDAQSHINLYSKTPENKMLYFTPNHTKYIPKDDWADLEYHYLVENREFSVEFLRKMIDDAHRNGFLVCHNHPTWSFEDERYADAYEACFAMEIYNHSSYMGGHNEHNAHFYDYQLNRGRRMALIAADDNHNARSTEDPRCDSFGGVTYILAEKLNYESIITALEKKDFYASCGPQIFSLTVDNGVFNVKTSPVSRICFVTNAHKRGVTVAAKNETVTQSEFTPNEKVKWVYVEITDEVGNKAYSRAFFQDEWQDA